MEAREVALLLTDVEGSTGLLVRRGQVGVDALARVAELVAQVTAEHGGWISRSQGEGDSAVAVFDTAASAVAAALRLNEVIAHEPWGAEPRLAVRSAVHVGEVTVDAGGLFGLEVHRCARLRGLADGGEVFLSAETVRRAGSQLPAGSRVADEGQVTLRGFDHVERVWRLVHPALRPRRRRIPRSAPPPSALPVWRTSFVGRSVELATVTERLGPGRLVTLVGAGGVGKTRLAVAAAASIERPRACFVDLTRATDGDEVAGLAAELLGADASDPPLVSIEELLAVAPALVVLDNCEHVADAVTTLLDHVLIRCPTSSFLATSRAALRVAGEEVIPIAPLPADVAAALFIDRARAVRADLVTDGDARADIAELASLLDGVPLAIELAAARASAFSVAEVLGLLKANAVDLGDRRRHGPDRHRTLRSAIDWSMRMLDVAERSALCQLAMLPGSFRLRTAEAVVAARGDVGSALGALVHQSLVVSEQRAGPTRFRLLEMIRAIGRDGLSPAERRAVLDRLLQDCLAQVAPVEAIELPEDGLEAEIIRDRALYAAAVEHAVSTGQTEDGLRLVHDLFVAWPGATQRWMLDRWMSSLVAASEGPSRLRGSVLRRQAIIASELQGDRPRALALLDAAERDAEALGDRQLLGRVRGTRCGVDYDGGQLEDSRVTCGTPSPCSRRPMTSTSPAR
ncbi:MAG: ATP-binding protein [Ilumatobacteraceae bacterium]